MKNRIYAAALAACLLLPSASPAQARWFKGNTHMHSNRSDGELALSASCKWYHDNGYDYIVPTDHRVFLGDYAISIPNRRADFLIIQGEEFHSLTGYGDNHATVINAGGALGDIAAGSTKVWEYFNKVYALAAAKQGLPFINHPTWSSLVSADDLMKVQGFMHFEIFNGAQDTDNYGIFGSGMPPIEGIWDSVLTRGAKFYGVGSDDLHKFTTRPGTSNPMTGWTMLKAPRLGTAEILDAYRKGSFYATNGVMLKDLSTTLGLYKVAVDPEATRAELARRDKEGFSNPARPVKSGNPGFRIDFIGPKGKVLKSVAGDTASFQATKDLAYVRCRVAYLRNIAAGGAPYDTRLGQAEYVKANAITREEYYAWGQPYFTDSRREGPALVFGCMDPAYLEYDPKANVADQAACKNKSSGIRSMTGPGEARALSVEVAPSLGDYVLLIRALSGKLLRRIEARPDRRHRLEGLAPCATYIVEIRGRKQVLAKRVWMP